MASLDTASVITFIGGMLVVVGALLSARGSNIAAVENRKLNSKLQSQVGENHRLTEEVRTLTQRIDERSEYVVDSVSGEKSYLACNIQFSSERKAFLLTAFVEGEGDGTLGAHSMEDVTVQIISDYGIGFSYRPQRYSTKLVHVVDELPIPDDRNAVCFTVLVIAKDRNYKQDFLLKKHTDGT